MATSQPSAGVGVRHPASSRPATSRVERRRSRWRGRRARRAAAGRSSVASSGLRTSAVSRVAAQRSRIRARRAASSESTLARPRPRTRSSVAWTSSRLPATALVDAERLDGAAVGRPADAALEVGDRPGAATASVRAATQSSTAARNSGLGEQVGQHLQHRPRARRAGGQRLGARDHLVVADRGQVVDGREHQVVLGREVVQLGATADAGALRDQRGRGAAPAVLDQALDGGVEQPLAHGAGALLLGHPGGRAGHGQHSADVQTNSQACLFVCPFPDVLTRRLNRRRS